MVEEMLGGAMWTQCFGSFKTAVDWARFSHQRIADRPKVSGKKFDTLMGQKTVSGFVVDPVLPTFSPMPSEGCSKSF